MIKKTNIKNKKQNNTKTNIIIIIFVVVIFLFMASGYAILNTKLTINGKGELDIPEYKIFINDIKVDKTFEGGYQTSSPTFTDNEIAMYTSLPNLNSKVVYEITIKNTGASTAIVDAIYTSSNQNNLKYRIIGVKAEDSIKGLSNVTVKIEIMYSENATVTNENLPLMIQFRFLKKTNNYSNACTLNWDGSSTAEPLTVDIYGKTYYRITNANELNWFKKQIDAGNNTINAILDNDICLNNQSFSLASANAYKGIFDGQNRAIRDIRYSRDVELEKDNTYHMGLFINNAGTIKNVNVSSTLVDKNIAKTSTGYNYFGGIVVNNTGIIENTSYSGSIEVNSQAIVNCLVKQAHNYTYIGGIAATNTGIVRGSVNKASFKITGYASYITCNLYSRSVNIFSGGIVGLNQGYVSDSYNQALIEASGSTKSDTRTTYIGLVGGLIGNNEKKCDDTYNSANVIQTLSGATEGSSSGIIGKNTGELSNVYYLVNTADNHIGTEVSASDLINLNINLSTAFLKSASYPKLFWE